MLSDADRTRIVEAIRQAETRTSGEIYCVVARASSTYRVFPIAYAATAALIVPGPLIQLTSWPAGLIYLLQLLTFLFILWLATRDAIRYRLVPRQTRRARCHQEALKQFLAHGLQHTERRTGVLIFLGRRALRRSHRRRRHRPEGDAGCLGGLRDVPDRRGRPRSHRGRFCGGDRAVRGGPGPAFSARRDQPR